MSFDLVQIDSPKYSYLWNSISQTPLHKFVREIKENLADQFDFLLILNEHISLTDKRSDKFIGGKRRCKELATSL